MFLVKYLFLSQSTWPLAQSSGSMTPDRFKCTVLKYKYGWGRRFRWQHTKLVSFKWPSLTSQSSLSHHFLNDGARRFGGMEPERRVEDKPRRAPARVLRRRDPGVGAGPAPAPAPTCWSALLWRRRSPRRARLAGRPRPPPPKKQETQKVSEPGCLRKVGARSWCLGARAWREQCPGWRPPHKVQAQTDPPRAPRCLLPGLEASRSRGQRTPPCTPT